MKIYNLEKKENLNYSVGNIDEFRVSYVDEIPVNRTLIDDAIDKIKEFTSNIMKKVGNVSIDGAADSIKNAFEPVHVEGNDFEIFVAVMWILYAIPPGAIWFIF